MTARTLLLGVNIDHVATVRQARGGHSPDPLLAALTAEQWGADSITLHLREDRRHIQDRDVRAMRGALQTRMNLEIAVTEEMLAIATRVQPQDVCLVPERRSELTTEGGLDVAGQLPAVGDACRTLAAAGIRVALFIDPDPAQVDAAARSGASVVELHTGAYSEAQGPGRARELDRLATAARQAASRGLIAHAGHGLDYHNAQPAWLGLAVVMQGCHLIIRSLRWRTLLTPMKKKIGFYNLFSTTAIGYMLSFLLFRIGEVVRPLLLGQRERISKSGALATCVLERLMDFLTVALLFGVYLIFRFDAAAPQVAGLDIGKLRTTGLIFGVVTVACFPALYVIVHFRQRLFAFFDRRMGSDAALPRLIHAFLGGFDAVKGWRLLTLAWLQSFGVWLSIAGAIWASLRAFDLGVDFMDSFLMVALLAFGIAVPTPGGAGSFEYLGQLGLQFFGVSPNRAAAAIIVTHVTSIAPVMLVGMLLIWKDGLSLKGLTGMGEKANR